MVVSRIPFSNALPENIVEDSGRSHVALIGYALLLKGSLEDAVNLHLIIYGEEHIGRADANADVVHYWPPAAAPPGKEGQEQEQEEGQGVKRIDHRNIVESRPVIQEGLE